jgi:beta-N-acetylhexosaminidase
MTDDLGMKALGGSLTDRANASIEAGCDVLLHCSGFVKTSDGILAEMTEVAEAAPVLAGRAAERAAVADAIAKQAEPLEPAKAWQRFRELLPQVGAGI